MEADTRLIRLKRVILIVLCVGLFVFGHLFCRHPISDEFKNLAGVRELLQICIWLYSFMGGLGIGIFDLAAILFGPYLDNLATWLLYLFMGVAGAFSFFAGIVTFDEINSQQRVLMKGVFDNKKKEDEEDASLQGSEIIELMSRSVRLTFHIKNNGKLAKAEVDEEKMYKIECVEPVEEEGWSAIRDFPVYAISRIFYNEKYYTKINIIVSLITKDKQVVIDPEPDTETVKDMIPVVQYEDVRWYIDKKDFSKEPLDSVTEGEDAAAMCQLGGNLLGEFAQYLGCDAEKVRINGEIKEIDEKIITEGECIEFKDILNNPLYIRSGPQITIQAQIGGEKSRDFFIQKRDDGEESFNWEEQKNAEQSLLVIELDFEEVEE